jgi:hypothetical protein
LKEADKLSLIDATRDYEERKNAPASSSALPVISEDNDEVAAPAYDDWQRLCRDQR